MASVVKIELQMDDNGVLTGFRNIDAAGTKVQTTFKAVAMTGNQMSEALKQTATSATSAGEAMQAAGAKGAAAMDDVRRHTLTSFDIVRLFRDEFGIHVPRSMEKAMASSSAVMGVLNAMQGPMLAFGAVGIGVALGRQLYDVWEKFTAVDDAVLKFNEDLSKAAHTKFMDTSSIEDTREQIMGLSEDLKLLDKQRAQIGQSLTKRIEGHMYDLNPVSAVHDIYKEGKHLDQLDSHRNQTQADLDTQQRNSAKQFHETRMRDIEVEAKKAAAIENAQARAFAENKLAHQRDSEDTRYATQQSEMERTVDNRTRSVGDQILANPDAGKQALKEKDDVADAELAAKNIEYARQEADDIRRLEREANNASLRGYQLLEAQRMDAREDFVHKYGQSTAALSAIDKRYYQEETRASEQLARELERDRREASLSGLSGIGLTQARGRNKDAEIDDEMASGRFSAFGDKGQQQAAADALKQQNHQETNDAIEKEEQRFTESIDQMAMQSADKQVQGFARINAETSKQLNELQKKFEDVYGNIADKTSPEYLQGLAALNKGRAAVQESGKSQAQQLAEKNADDTAKIEAEAYRSSLPAMQQHEQEIIDVYNERTRQYAKMLHDQQISQEDFDKRTAAAAREMNAQLAADAEQQRNKIASELEPFMGAHPLRALEAFGAHQASLAGADYLEKMSGGNAPFFGKGKKGQSFTDLLAPHHFGKGSGEPGAHGASVQDMTLSANVVNVYGGSVRGAGGGSGYSGTAFGGGAPAHGFGSPSAASAAAVHMGGSVQDLGAQLFGRKGVAMPTARIADGTTGSSTVDSSGAGVPWAAPSSYDSTLGMVAAPSGFTPGTPGAVGVSNDINSAMGDFGTIQGIGSSIGGSSQGSGDGTPSSDASGGSNSGSTALNTIGSYGSAGAGLFSAVESNGGVGGALSGAASGAKLGGLLGGPAGAAVGAALGAVVGAIGIGGAQKAVEYERKEVRPHLAGTLLAFGMGSMPYQSAYSDLQSLDHTAQQTTRKFGPGGVREYNNHIKVEIQSGLSQLTREQKAGRSQYGMAAAQFDGGGTIQGFGDFGTGPDSGWIHAQRGEVVMHQLASETHGDALGLMLANASRRQMADYYGAREMAPSYRATMQHSAFGGGSVTNHYGHTINAVDAKSVQDLLMSNKHVIRSAVTQSYAENSGGADLG